MKKSVEDSESTQVLSYAVVNGATLKYNVKDTSQKFKVSNSAFNYELGYKPASWNNDEKTLNLKHASKFDPTTGTLESTESIKLGLSKVGPLGVWTTVSKRAKSSRLFSESFRMREVIL